MIKKIKIIAVVLISWQYAMVGAIADDLPTSEEVANTVTNKWINQDFSQLGSYITNLYAAHPNYVPAVLAASFHDYIYLGLLAEALNKLDDVQLAVDLDTESFTIEFEDLLWELRTVVQDEINLHERMATSPETLQSNASPQTVRSVWGETLLPSINILFYAPAERLPYIVTVKLKPDKWNIQWTEEHAGLGLVNCYIGNLSGNYTLKDIKADTIRLNKDLPIWGNPQILGHQKGFLGKVTRVKFPKFKAINTMESIWPGKLCNITITGELKDGKSFIGIAKIKIVEPGFPP